MLPTRWNWRWMHLAAISATVVHKPRLLSDNGSSYVAADLAEYLDGQGHGSRSRCARTIRTDPGQDRALASNHEKPHLYWKTTTCLATWSVKSVRLSITTTTSVYQESLEQPDTRRRLSRPRHEDPEDQRGDQETDNPKTTLAPPICSPAKLKQKPNQSLRYKTAPVLRKTLTTDSLKSFANSGRSQTFRVSRTVSATGMTVSS